MDLVWDVDYQQASQGVRVRVISTIAVDEAKYLEGFTADPAIVALACTAFTHRLWVHMTINLDGQRITAMNVLPDCSLAPLPPGTAKEGAVSVEWLRLVQSDFGQWPEVEVHFADGQHAMDKSKKGFIEPIVRAGLISGEGVFDLDLQGDTIRRVRVTYGRQENSATD